MPPKAARPPKKGSKKDLENKALNKIKSEDNLETVFKGISLEEGHQEPDDEGRNATDILISEILARDI
jgi:hypothetical protein